MFRRLQELAAGHGVEFGVKLTNTFPVDVAAGELPSEEMYMSGRSLFPLSITLASRLSQEFEGQLRVSYSGGADLHSVKALDQAGIWPITVATTLLKLGGYQRFRQLGWEPDSLGGGSWTGVDPKAAAALAQGVFEDNYYRKPIKAAPSRKLEEKVPLTSCFTAPCRGGCPIHFVLSLISPISMGLCTLAFNLFFLLCEGLLIGKFTITQAIQVPVTILFSLCVDGALALIPSQYGGP
ncbi:hypothetical protein D1646_16940 [Pseudoflavonifractor sp. 60]|uniref:hypothetical protein n=1 Tax=Pseudoflavonifractor sp. 60 TaxID=2304576 RepID=UPI001371BEB1|nr:hypothetical protein [Pseudoflavonifractor sp. 60]NBI68449.1 hypothetical protein [Pseudoflavonifractor sp. 60]